MALTVSSLGDEFFAPFLRGFGRDLAPMMNDREVEAYTRHVPIDVKETEKSYELKADIPGVEKNDIKVTVDGDVLSLEVHREEKKEEQKEQQGVKFHRAERSSRFVRRALRMPDNANLKHIKAKYENGVLMLEVPKTHGEDRKRHVAIQ